MDRIRSHFDLRVYQAARAAAIRVFQISKAFPPNERYDLINQIRRASRAVCALIAEAWRKRRYPAAFVAKLNEAEGEAAETQTWIDLAEGYGYVDQEIRDEVVALYEQVIGQLVIMSNQAPKWTAGSREPAPSPAHPVSQFPSPPVT